MKGMDTDEALSLCREYRTPFYLFDADVLRLRVAAIQKRLPRNARLCYAIKANPFLVRYLSGTGILFEVCSPGELSICERLHVSPSQIVFSGVCKTQEDVSRAYMLGVDTITLESPAHCRYLLDAVAAAGALHKQDVILRLSGGNQFGMTEAGLKQCLADIARVPNLRVRGIHFFTGTQKKAKKILEEVRFITDFCDRLQEQTGVRFTDIEYGPGLAYDYFSGGDAADDFGGLEQFSAAIAVAPYQFVVELGRYIASPCGTYVTAVMDVKNHDGGKYLIVDGGINHINYYGQMLGMKVPPVVHHRAGSRNEAGGAAADDMPACTVCGSLCTTADVIIRNLPLHRPQVGDVLEFQDIGAYSITEGIYLFLSHPFPAVLGKANGMVEVLRNHQESYILNCEESKKH